MGKYMKQIIVLISSIILGIAIAGMVMAFESDAQGLADAAKVSLATIKGAF